MITKCDVFENQNLRLLYPRKWGNLSLWTWYKTYLPSGIQATVDEAGSPDPLGSWVLHMKSIEVVIEGVAPLLMNRRPLEDFSETKKKSDVYDPKNEAEKKSYFDNKLGYYVPSEMLEASWREGGKNIKNGRSSSKKLVQSSMFVLEEKIPLNRKDYDEVDNRWGTHPSTGNSVLVSRVRFDKWKLSFTLSYDDMRIAAKKAKEIVEEAAATCGIGSYKPKFGRYKVVKFAEK